VDKEKLTLLPHPVKTISLYTGLSAGSSDIPAGHFAYIAPIYRVNLVLLGEIAKPATKRSIRSFREN
jgi:hypothetical protein